MISLFLQIKNCPLPYGHAELATLAAPTASRHFPATDPHKVSELRAFVKTCRQDLTAFCIVRK